MATPRKARGFTLVELLVVITIIGMLMALLLPAIQSARETGRRNTCANNMRQCVLALTLVEQSKKSFPGYANVIGGKRASWIVPILPALEQNDLYRVWTSVAPVTVPKTADGMLLIPATPGMSGQNPWAHTTIASLLCPSNPAVNAGSNPLCFVANCGIAINADDNKPTAMPGMPKNPWTEDINTGIFVNHSNDNATIGYNPTSLGGSGKKVNIDFITSNDGTTNTIMLSENLQSSNWAADPTVDLTTASPDQPWQSDWQIKQNTGMVWFFQNTQNNEDTTNSKGINSQKDYNSPLAITDDLTFSRPSSQHPGGVGMVFCDGHYQFVAEEVSYKVYTQLMTPNQKKAVIPKMSGGGTTTPPNWATPWNYILNSGDY